LITGFLFLNSRAAAQNDPNKLGAWYMYFWKADVYKKFGLQGDYQYRNRNLVGDHEQILLRTGLTFKAYHRLLLTQGYAYIMNSIPQTAVFNNNENRLYQEALLSNSSENWAQVKHRFRFEQRFTNHQFFRTRFRYALFMNFPLNSEAMGEHVLYLAVYEEIFINGQTQVTSISRVSVFDRNRLYLGLGFGMSDQLNAQLGIMNQHTPYWNKFQLQFSLHHSIER
jgi:hypothetical protein